MSHLSDLLVLVLILNSMMLEGQSAAFAVDLLEQLSCRANGEQRAATQAAVRWWWW